MPRIMAVAAFAYAGTFRLGSALRRRSNCRPGNLQEPLCRRRCASGFVLFSDLASATDSRLYILLVRLAGRAALRRLLLFAFNTPSVPCPLTRVIKLPTPHLWHAPTDQLHSGLLKLRRLRISANNSCVTILRWSEIRASTQTAFKEISEAKSADSSSRHLQPRRSHGLRYRAISSSHDCRP